MTPLFICWNKNVFFRAQYSLQFTFTCTMQLRAEANVNRLPTQLYVASCNNCTETISLHNALNVTPHIYREEQKQIICNSSCQSAPTFLGYAITPFLLLLIQIYISGLRNRWGGWCWIRSRSKVQVDKIFRNNKYDLIDQQYQQHFQHGLSAEICSANSVERGVQCEQRKNRSSGTIPNLSTSQRKTCKSFFLLSQTDRTDALLGNFNGRDSAGSEHPLHTPSGEKTRKTYDFTRTHHVGTSCHDIQATQGATKSGVYLIHPPNLVRPWRDRRCPKITF